MTNCGSHIVLVEMVFLVLVQTDKTDRVIVETRSDLQNLMILRKSNREQKSAVRRVDAPPVVHTAVMHNTM